MVGSLGNSFFMDLGEKLEPLPQEFDPKEISCGITSEVNGAVGENGKEREIVLGRNVHTMCLTIDEPEADDEVTGEKEAYMAGVLARYRKSLLERTKHHLGYPYNLDFDYGALGQLQHFSINNLGDPFIESNYGVHSRQFEVGVLDWFARLWELEKDEYWGYITNCGTEGNLHGILVGREVFPDGILYASKESHYSVFKAARMYRMECVKVNTLISGEIDCADFAAKLILNKDKPAVINVNIGTTVKGAVDDLDLVIKTLEETGFTDRFYIHCDGALFGLMMPFVKRAPKVTFKKAIGSVSVSGHKFVGCPMPCGVQLTRLKHINALSRNVEYLASRDATIMGSRNGHAPIFLWYTLNRKGYRGFQKEVQGHSAGGRRTEANETRRLTSLSTLMAVKIVLLLVFLSAVGSGGVSISRHIKRLNKPAVKSIKSPDGDVIDCVHVSLQPAFDHPFLKNHTIQMTPSFHPDGLYDVNKVSSESISQLWHANGRCPENTVPIRRTKREDVLRASSVKRFGRKKQMNLKHPMSAEPDLVNQSGHQHAIAYVEGGEYYGTKATINVWNPQIQQHNEFSLSQLWILGGTFGQDLNSIEAGWQVSPDLYGDNNTRLFTYWTSDAYQATGCYNLFCSGFIQISSEIAMGASISPISNSGGSQYDISLLVWKDPKEGHWWLQFGDKYVLGYWPSFLFSYLADSASMIEWGGEVVNSDAGGQHTTTQMGSGHFPEDGFSKASYFRNIQVVDESNNLKPPKGMGIFTEQSNCYDVQIGNSGDWGHYFYYGGPGRNPNCP